MPTPINNDQPSLGLHEVVKRTAFFPARDGSASADPGGMPLAAIRTFAGDFNWGSTAFADGQLLSISQNTALFSLLGTTFGGNGQTTFALPNLQGRTMVGAPTANDEGQQTGADSITLTGANMPAGGG